MGIAVVAIIILLSFFSEKIRAKQNASNKIKKSNLQNTKSSNSSVLLVNCPLCNSPLQKGQNLVSKVFRPMNVPDQRCNISGCPHCYPQPEPGIKRQCPCCKKEVPITGYLIARLFNYKDNKKHVIVTGCSRCCEK